MRNNKRKFNVKESGVEVYTNNVSLISISRELNNSLCFESGNIHLNHYLSYDIGESVAAIMRIKGFKDDKFWSIIINDQHYDVDAEKCLYWLTGGDKVWRNVDKKYKHSWRECSSLFVDKFSDIIYDIIDESVTLEDIKNLFKTHLNLNIFYEFALENDLIK